MHFPTFVAAIAVAFTLVLPAVGSPVPVPGEANAYVTPASRIWKILTPSIFVELGGTSRRTMSLRGGTSLRKTSPRGGTWRGGMPTTSVGIWRGGVLTTNVGTWTKPRPPKGGTWPRRMWSKGGTWTRTRRGGTWRRRMSSRSGTWSRTMPPRGGAVSKCVPLLSKRASGRIGLVWKSFGWRETGSPQMPYLEFVLFSLGWRFNLKSPTLLPCCTTTTSFVCSIRFSVMLAILYCFHTHWWLSDGHGMRNWWNFLGCVGARTGEYVVSSPCT